MQLRLEGKYPIGHDGLRQVDIAQLADGQKNLIPAGKVRFHSHKIQNNASSNLAQQRELQLVFEEMVFIYADI